MSRSLARLVHAVLLIAITPGGYLLLYLILRHTYWGRSPDALVTAALFCAAVMIPVWILLWRKQVVWTISRVILTILLVPGSAAVAFAGFGLWAIGSPWNSGEYGVLIGAFCWLIAWVAGTVIVWRETNFEAVQRRAAVFDRHLKCPGCGYDLHGLDVPRCPECGTRFTLGELLASMIRADLL